MGTRQAWSDLHYRRSLASRVTLLTTMAVGIAVTVVAFAAYATVRMQSMDSIDDSLHTRAEAAAKPGPLAALDEGRVPTWALGAGDVKLVVVDAGASARRSPDRPGSGSRGRRDGVPRGRRPGGRGRRAACSSTASATARSPCRCRRSDGQALVLSQSLASTDRMLDRLGLVMLLFGLAGMISAALAGWGVARNGLRPVRRLTTAVEEIARTERLDPIPVEGRDEVARLSMAFNAMLASLSASQARQRQLVADAGHELRTPLTSLRTNLDLLAQADVLDQALRRVPQGAAGRRPRPDRGDDHPDRRPGGAGPRRPVVGAAASSRSSWRQSSPRPSRAYAGAHPAWSST